MKYRKSVVFSMGFLFLICAAVPAFSGYLLIQQKLRAKNVSNNSGYDVPDFFATVNDGNLRFMGKDEYITSWNTHHKRYKYQCDIGNNNNYVGRYLQKLGSYPFTLTKHWTNDFRSSSAAVYENWLFRYIGSKHADTFITLDENSTKKLDTHLHIWSHLDGFQGTIEFMIDFSPSLTYDDRSTVNINANPSRGSSGSSSYSDSRSSSSSAWSNEKPKTRCYRCGGDGKVRCSACDGHGGRYEYSHTPNYSGSLRGSSTARTWHDCSKCYGRGEVSCPECGGKGYIRH